MTLGQYPYNRNNLRFVTKKTKQKVLRNMTETHIQTNKHRNVPSDT